jgi:hypothetical protein
MFCIKSSKTSLHYHPFCYRVLNGEYHEIRAFLAALCVEATGKAVAAAIGPAEFGRLMQGSGDVVQFHGAWFLQVDAEPAF